MRRAAALAGGAVLLLAAAVGVAEWRGWPFLRQPLASRLEAALGVPVRLEGDFRASLLGAPSLAVGRLRVGAGGGLDLPHLVDARSLELAWRWGDLWRLWRGQAPLTLRRVTADALDARLVRLADGRASWRMGRAEPPPPGEPPALPRVGWLQLRQGFVVVDDAPLATRLELRLEGGEGAPAAGADAGWRARLQGRWRDLPLDLRLVAGAALPLVRDTLDGDAAGPEPLLPLRVEGRAGAADLRFDGRVGALAGARRLDGALRIAGPSLAEAARPFGVTLPRTPPFELAGAIGHDGGVWTLRAERAVIGDSRIGGEFRFDTRGRPSKLTGRLVGARLALADLGPAVGTPPPARSRPANAANAGKAAKAPAAPPGARVLPARRFDLPSLRGMDADVQVAIDTLDFGTPAVGPLHGVRTHLLLAGGVLTLRELHAGVAGGRVDGTTTLDGNADPARWGADLRFEGVDLAGWLPAVRTARGERGAGLATRGVGAYITGIVGGALQAHGRGRSTAEILGSLDGHALVTLRDGTLSHLVTEALGLDVAQAVGVIVRGDAPLPLRCGRLELALKDGVARVRQAVLDNRDSTLRITGEVNLREETLALQARARPKDFSPLSLRSPITVGGRFSRPEIGLDAGKLAGKVLGSVLLGAVIGPLAAVVPFMDPGEDDPGDPCAAPRPPAPRQKVER
jgi:uncharacterized protein involved in outer membrane biogenesis